jgi:hypothetical protein
MTDTGKRELGVVTMRLRRIELTALRSIVIDHAIASAKPNSFVTTEWIDVLTDEKATVNDLLALIVNAYGVCAE